MEVKDNLFIGTMHSVEPAAFVQEVVDILELAHIPLPPILAEWKEEEDKIRAWYERNMPPNPGPGGD